MKEESELKNQPDEIDLDKNSKNLRNLDRPTPVVEAKTAEEILQETFERHNNDPNSKLGIIEIECEAIHAYHAQFTTAAKGVEVEEAGAGLREENERLRDEGIRLLNGIRRISEIIDDELAESICRELLRP